MIESNNSVEITSDANVSTVDVAVGIGHTNASEAADSIKLISRTAINVDFSRNPRQLSKYDRKKASMQWLARSLVVHGLQEPLVVSQRADGTIWLLKGHRRYSAILIVVEFGVDKSGSGIDAQPALPADPNFMSKVRCRVLKGLTIQGEMDMLMDHVDIVGLDRAEKLLSAKILTSHGFTHEFIARKVGMSRPNYSNSLGRVLQLPSCVESEYLSEAKERVAITQKAIKALGMAYDLDQKTPGARLKTAGPNFAAKWEEVKVGLADDKAMSRKDIREVAGVVGDTDLQELLEAISNNAREDVGSALHRIKARLAASPGAFSTQGTGVVTVEEGIPSTVGDFVQAD